MKLGITLIFSLLVSCGNKFLSDIEMQNLLQSNKHLLEQVGRVCMDFSDVRLVEFQQDGFSINTGSTSPVDLSNYRLDSVSRMLFVSGIEKLICVRNYSNKADSLYRLRFVVESSGFVFGGKLQALDYIFDSDHETASEEIRLGILKNTDFNDWYIYSYSGS
jgi:hypothetical protein